MIENPTTRPSFAQLLCHTLPPIVAPGIGRLFIAREQKSKSPFVTRTLTGAIYADRRGNVIADSVRIRGFWEWRNLALAQIFCRPGGHIAEIGANTGTETVGFADIVGPRGRVTAFEPDPHNIDVLTQNIRRNEYHNVTVRGVAVTEKAGTVNFAPPKFKENSGTGYIVTKGNEPDAVEVPAVTIDSISEELMDVQFFSIDVEGFEIPVLRGARAHLARYRPVLLLEAHSEELLRAGYGVMDLQAELSSQRYEAFEVTRLDVRPVISQFSTTSPYYRNWLCLPSERAAERRRVRSVFLRWAFSPRAGYLTSRTLKSA